jgi:hypothetical protein
LPADGSLWSSVGNRIFIELCNTGCWRHYYTHAQFLDEVRNVLYLPNQWAHLAGVPVSEPIELQQNIKQNDRHDQNAAPERLNPLTHSAAARRCRPASAILAAVAGRL